MPLSALRHVVVDHNVPLRRIVEVCASIVAQPPPPNRAPMPAALRHEHDLAMNDGEPMTHLPAIARPSAFVCPDCNGGLWELNDVTPMRFRCHTGHAYTLRTLQHAQSLATDESLWSAFRALQEQKLLLEKGIESGALEAREDAPSKRCEAPGKRCGGAASVDRASSSPGRSVAQRLRCARIVLLPEAQAGICKPAGAHYS
jgi:two-component system, chemotaxis family, protein-glutamate methylesterase/glutaminase